MTASYRSDVSISFILLTVGPVSYSLRVFQLAVNATRRRCGSIMASILAIVFFVIPPKRLGINPE